MDVYVDMCWKCGACFFSQSKLQEHQRTKHFSETFVCYLCEKKFSYSHVLLQHMNAHSRNIHSCGICGKLCEEQIDMYIHIIMFHMYLSKISCVLCTKMLDNSYQLKGHILKDHGDDFVSFVFKGESYCTIHSSRKFLKDDLLLNSELQFSISHAYFKAMEDDEIAGGENSKHSESSRKYSGAVENKYSVAVEDEVMGSENYELIDLTDESISEYNPYDPNFFELEPTHSRINTNSDFGGTGAGNGWHALRYNQWHRNETTNLQNSDFEMPVQCPSGEND